MNIKRAKEEIKDSIEAYLAKDDLGNYEIPRIRQRPILLLGAPGIGKTQIMEQIAKECGIGLVSYTITHHTRQSAIGLPFISQKEYGGKSYSVTEYTMSEIVASVYDKMEQTGLTEGILFIDEINCVSETLAPAMLQFLQCKTFGCHEIPNGWIIVAAGNPPEYNKSVREFDVVTMDRVKKMDVEQDFSVWKEYAWKEQVHPAVISYLSLRTKYFYQMETTVDGRIFATPRGWEDLSTLIKTYGKLGKPVDYDVVVQYIQHPKAAKDFATYLELYRKYREDYQIEEILLGKDSTLMQKKAAHASFDERLSIVSLLISGCSQEFRTVGEKEAVLELLYPVLKRFKEQMDRENWAEIFEQETDNVRQEYEEKKQAELLSRAEERTYRQAGQILEQMKQVLKAGTWENAEAVFEKIRELFGKEKAEYETAYDKAGSVLEHVFDFLEAAFEAGQEMVWFITELNSGFYSVQFLQEYACERYQRYNRELLFDQGRQKILERIQAL